MLLGRCGPRSVDSISIVATIVEVLLFGSVVLFVAVVRLVRWHVRQ